MVLIGCCSFNLILHPYNIVYNLSAIVTLSEYTWLFIFIKVVTIFIQNMDVVYIVHPSTFISAKITKKGVKFC
jgi:hypothetical protein